MEEEDIKGRYIIKGGEKIWMEGKIKREVREGGIC